MSDSPRDRLCDLLIRVPALGEYANRTTLLKKLPLSLEKSVPRSTAPKTDVDTIVEYVSGWGNLDDDTSALEIVMGNARPFVQGGSLERELDEVIALSRQSPPEPATAGPAAGAATVAPLPIDRVIATLAERITTSGNLVKSRRAVQDLTKAVLDSDSVRAREQAIDRLKDAFHEDIGGGPVSPPVRDTRRAIMKAIATIATKELRHYFQDGELEGIDLMRLDFSDASLARVSFRGAFLIESLFPGADLRRANFSGACIRNVHFEDAALDGADFTDADWFNAAGLTEGQLDRVDRKTLRPCPADVEGFHRVLEELYAFPFSSWDGRVQKELEDTWAEYLRPGGLRDVVAAWNAA